MTCISLVALLAFSQPATNGANPVLPMGFVAEVTIVHDGQKCEGRVIVESGGRIFVEGMPERHQQWLAAQLQQILRCGAEATSDSEWSRMKRLVAVVASDRQARCPSVIAIHQWNVLFDEFESAQTIAVGWKKVMGVDVPRDLRIVEAKRAGVTIGRVTLGEHRLLSSGSALVATRFGE